MDLLPASHAFTDARHILNTTDEKRAAILAIADAVAFAHDHDIRHLDLSPGNVRILPDGTPRIIDFGLADKLDSARPHKPELIGRGSIRYMAPEQFGAEFGEIGKPTDVHALGVLIYQFLTDHFPYDRRPDDRDSDFWDYIRTQPRKPLPPNCDLSELAPILAKALSLRPTDRYGNARQMHDALDPRCKPKSTASKYNIVSPNVTVHHGPIENQTVIIGDQHVGKGNIFNAPTIINGDINIQ